MRKIFFWLHLSVGVVAGLVIFLMSVTGVLLTYEKQMIAWFDERSLPERTAGVARLAVEELLRKAQEERGSAPSAISIKANDGSPVQLIFGREVAYQDAATGKILGSGNKGARQFFRVVTDWHRWLAMSGDQRSTGRAITGASNLAFLFIVCSGAYLWIPKVWSKANLRAILWFRGGLSGKARDFNWHNAIGIWCLVPLVFVVAAATVISYPWASNLPYRITGTQPPSASGPSPGNGPSQQTSFDLTGLNSLWDKAAKQKAGWRTITLRLPNSDRAPVTFTVDSGYPGQPQERLTIAMDRQSGKIRSAESFQDWNAGRRLRTWLRFVHTGEFYGIPGQTIAGIASLGGAFLAYTGVALSLRRFSAWRNRKTRERVTTGVAA